MTSGDGPAPPRPGSLVLTGIFLILTLAAVQQARDFLLPVVTALLLFFVLMPLHRVLQRVGVPATLSAGGLVVSLMLAVSVLFTTVSGPVIEAASDYPRLAEKVTSKVRILRASFDPPAAAPPVQSSYRDPSLNPPPAAPTADAEEDEGTSALMQSTANSALATLAGAPTVAAQVGFALILLFFLLSSSDLMYLKIVQSFARFRDKRAAYGALRRIEKHLGGYLGTVTAINAVLGLVIAGAMWALGMPAPLVFGVLAFAFNYIPYVGALVGVAVAGLVAVLTFDGWQTPLLVVAVYAGLTSLEGQLITPMLMARRMEMNTVVLLTAAAFWAWIWGPAGMLIAVPMMVALRVIADELPGWSRVALFLSAAADGPPPADDPEA